MLGFLCGVLVGMLSLAWIKPLVRAGKWFERRVMFRHVFGAPGSKQEAAHWLAKQRGEDVKTTLTAALAARTAWKAAVEAEAEAKATEWEEVQAAEKSRRRPEEMIEGLEKEAAEIEAAEELGETSYRESARGGAPCR